MNDTRLIRIYEDRTTKLTLSSQEIKDILSMSEIIGENNIVLHADGRLLVRHYVGFIQIKKTRLQICPKISNRIEPDEHKRAFSILLNLLRFSGFLNIEKIPKPQSSAYASGDLLELFIMIFIDELLMLFKREVNKGYNRKIENQTFIKGKVDFAKTILKNNFKRHLHYIT